MNPAQYIDIGLIDPPAHAHRVDIDDDQIATLARSIEQQGLINPLVVKATGKRFEVVAGHRRLLAHQQLRRLHVSCSVVDEATGDNTEAIKFAENFERTDLTPMEEALALKVHLDTTGISLDVLAHQVRRSVQWVEQRLTLLTLPDDIAKHLHEGTVKMGAAVALGKCEDQEHRQYLTQWALESGASVAIIEQWVNTYRSEKARDPNATPVLPTAAALGERPTIQWPCACCKEAIEVTRLQIFRVCGDCVKEIGL